VIASRVIPSCDLPALEAYNPAAVLAEGEFRERASRAVRLVVVGRKRGARQLVEPLAVPLAAHDIRHEEAPTREFVEARACDAPTGVRSSLRGCRPGLRRPRSARPCSTSTLKLSEARLKDSAFPQHRRCWRSQAGRVGGHRDGGPRPRLEYLRCAIHFEPGRPDTLASAAAYLQNLPISCGFQAVMSAEAARKSPWSVKLPVAPSNTPVPFISFPDAL